jgi:hypothetical protein
MKKSTKCLLIIATVFVLIHSLFPPRINPEFTRYSVDRVYFSSDYFYYSVYHKTPIEGQDDAYSVNSSPAVLDWRRYVMELVIICGLVALIILCKYSPDDNEEESSNTD